MIRILETHDEDVFATLRRRGAARNAETERIVTSIIADVAARGDAALLDNARRFDAPDLTELRVPSADLEHASIPETHAEAIRVAVARVRRFHEAQRDALTAFKDFRMPTLSDEAGSGTIGWRQVPVAAAGVYVPGGGATYPSSVVMNAVPALVAGVQRVAVTTPARRDGTLDAAVCFALREVGVTEAYRIGGAAAIAALALGTESIPRVDKIVGPGNRFVNEAKRQLWGAVGVDGYAGPSEVCVLADDGGNAEYAAADLLTQIEHAPDNSAFLVTTSREALDAILAAAARQLESAPRAATMRAALANESLAIVARDLDEAIDLVNAIAPEHLTLAVRDPEACLGRIRNAGCILMGEFTPESAGDFCLGPSHTLPTAGAARWQSPVNLLDFLKVQSVAHVSKSGIAALVGTIEAFGEIEGFPAHGFGGTVRRDATP